MKTMKTRMAFLVLAAALSGTAQAALQGRDLDGNSATFEAYYDTALDITWLADANYGAGSSYDDGWDSTDGQMTWANANDWAANLSIFDSVHHFTYDDWRLPTVSPVNGSTFNYNRSFNGSTDEGNNISAQGTAFAGSTGSEMAHLFHNTLNNKGFCNPETSTAYGCFTVADSGLTNTGPFANLVYNNYWSTTEYAPNTSSAWYFDFGGYQAFAGKDYNELYAFAVSPGDVAAVPEASTYAMMLAGLGLVGAAARRRRE